MLFMHVAVFKVCGFLSIFLMKIKKVEKYALIVGDEYS